MFHSHSSVMLLVDPTNGDIVEANAAAARYYGVSAERLQELNVRMLHQTGLDKSLEAVREHSLNMYEGPFEISHVLACGEERHVEVYVSPIEIDDRELHFAIIHDITERVLAEEARRRGEETFRALIEYSLDLTLVVDPEGILTFVSPSMERLLGHDPKGLLGSSAKSLMNPEDFDYLANDWSALMAVPGKVAMLTFRMQTADGRWRTMAANARNMIHAPEIGGVVFNARDITEQTRSHARLLEREAQLAEAQALAQVGSWEWDLESDELVWSKELKRIFGLAPDQTVTMGLYSEHIHPEDRDLISDAVVETRVVATGMKFEELRTMMRSPRSDTMRLQEGGGEAIEYEWAKRLIPMAFMFLVWIGGHMRPLQHIRALPGAAP